MTDAALSSLLPLAVALPIGGAILAPLGARLSKRLPLIVSVAAMAGSCVVLGLVAPRVYDGRLLTHFMGHWTPVNGAALGIAFTVDSFGLTYALAVAGIGALLLLYTLSELGGLGKRELGGYACLYQLLLAALIGSALTADVVNLFVWFEVAALASYGLTGFFLERPPALEATFKMLVLTTIASFGIFMAAALLYSNHGALNFGQLNAAIAGHAQTVDLVALTLLVAGFATKAGLMPFHGWLADAHTAAPGPVSAMFSALMVNMGVFAIARLALQVFTPDAARRVLGLLTAFGIVSAILGAVLALAQDDIKRLLAYDTVSQMGVLMVGIGTGTLSGVAGTTYHLVNHALFKALLFLCAGAIVHSTGITELSKLGGLGRRRPLLATVFVIGVLAIAGVPPLNGYASLGLIHDAVKHGHHLAIFGLLLVAQVVTIAALVRAAYLAFFRRRGDAYDELVSLHSGMVAAFVVLAAACIAFGIFPGFVMHHVAGTAAASLLAPATYAHAALSTSGANIAVPKLTFEYFAPGELTTVFATVAAGVALAWVYVKRPEPAPVRVLRALHNGSVNDYAAYAVAGTLVTALVFLQ